MRNQVEQKDKRSENRRPDRAPSPVDMGAITEQIDALVTADLQKPRMPTTTRQSTIMRMQQTQGNQAVLRFLAANRSVGSIQRDTPPAPPPAGAPPVADPATVPAAPGAAAGTPPKTHPTKWFVDYQELPMEGTAKKPKVRDPAKSAMYVKSLKIWPAGGTAVILTGVNAATSGKTEIGSATLPETAGDVSGVVNFGSKPSSSISVTVHDTAKDKDSKANGPIVGKVQAAVDAALLTLEETDGDSGDIQKKLQEKADEITIANSDDNHTYSANVTFQKHEAANSAPALQTTKYTPVQTDNTEFTANVKIPIQDVGGTWSYTKTSDAGKEAEKTQGIEVGTEVTTNFSEGEKKTVVKSVKEAVTAAFKNAWSQEDQKVDSSTTDFKAVATQKLSAEGTGKVDLASVLKLATKIPLVGKAVSWIVDLAGKMGEVEVRLGAEATTSEELGHSSNTTITHADVKSGETSISNQFESQWSSTTETQVTTQVGTSVKVVKRVGESNKDKASTGTSSTSSGKTIQVQTGNPAIDLQRVDGTAAPAGPTKI